MPSCEKLIDYNKFYKEQKRNEKKFIKEECPKYLIDLKKLRMKKMKKDLKCLMMKQNYYLLLL